MLLTCHLLHYRQESNQLENFLHWKFGLEVLHLYWHEEHILLGFLAPKLGKQHGSHFHEAANIGSVTSLWKFNNLYVK